MSHVSVPIDVYQALIAALRLQMDDNGHFHWCNVQAFEFNVQCSGKCVVARAALAAEYEAMEQEAAHVC